MGASLLVFKNKSDVPDSMSSDEIRRVGSVCSHDQQCPNVRQALQLDSIKTHRWTIMACSAMTGDNLEAGLRWVVKDAQDRLFLY